MLYQDSIESDHIGGTPKAGLILIYRWQEYQLCWSLSRLPIEVVVNINVLEEPIAFLITYVSWLSPKAVAEGFKLPIIDIQSTSICSFLVFAFFSHLLEKGYFPVQGAFLSLRGSCTRACSMFDGLLQWGFGKPNARMLYSSFLSLSLSLRFSARSTSPRAFTVEIQRSSYN